MRRVITSFLVIVFMLNFILGCAPLIIGAAVGGVGCYAVSKDTVQGDTDKSYDSVWDAIAQVSRIRGTIKQEDSGRGYLVLAADGSKVWIRLIRLTRATVRLRISARKFHLPNLTLAQDLYGKIMEEAR
ncbi:MAG: hypothetical protein NTW13_00335 [Candidatus Omnitrophica bacterium]|nr:hypothetical protein [Candidatus Omnitrophota bacterium]